MLREKGTLKDSNEEVVTLFCSFLESIQYFDSYLKPKLGHLHSNKIYGVGVGWPRMVREEVGLVILLCFGGI